jgi:O-antigen ligase
MSFPEFTKDASAPAPPPAALPKITTQLAPEGSSWWPAVCLLFPAVFSAAWVLAGIEAATMLLALLIGGFALVQPRSGLWASTAFMVYAFVFFQRSSQAGSEMPWEFYYWAAGISIITLGLCIARLRVPRGRSSSTKTPQQAKFDRAMLLMLLVILVAALYGLYEGNNFLAVARQLFGCLLLPVYYWLGKSFFRTPEDVDHWLHLVSWAVVAGAGWYAAKLAVMSVWEGAYYREQSQLGTYVGAIGAVLFVQFLEGRRFRKRLLLGAAFVVCVLALVMLGARVITGSLAATSLIFAFVRREKRSLARRFLGLAFLVAVGSFAVTAFAQLVQEPGLLGQIADRFSPYQLDEDNSYVGRLAQWQEVADITQQHPLLGAGLGAEFSYSFLLAAGTPQSYVTTYVDNGWGFVLLKMGTLGLVAFLFLAGTFLWFGLDRVAHCSDPGVKLIHKCLLAIVLYGLIGFIGGPSFFHFTQSGFFGTACGALAALAGERTRFDRVSK